MRPRSYRHPGVNLALAALAVLPVGTCSLAGPPRGASTEVPATGTPPEEPRREAGERPAMCAPSRGQEVMEFLNIVRGDEGLPPLSVDLRLVEAARRHARDLAQNDLMGHEGSDQSTPAERVTRAGYDWMFVAENVAGGQERAGEVVRGWMDSPGHRRNIVDGRARHVGVGFVEVGGSHYGTYWVSVYASTPDSALAPRSGCHP